ncbi:DUF1989 domain-containing protein [Neotabrizicola sp. VNH66]|uniref:DUF1989 domain-containing protein n=1 Tax=Neotabrizicola sp. VNH66 TaxID=3400918 RepID=UPI003C07F810
MTQDERILPAAQGIAVPLRRGQSIRVINTHGTQVVDTWVLSADDALDYGAMEHTRSVNSGIYLGEGDRIVSIHRRPLMTLVEDRSPGRHDTQLCPCSAEIYAELGHVPHRSCTDNFHEAIGRLGLSLPFTPASLNLFMNVPIDAQGKVTRVPPTSAPGDSVTLRAETDVVVVLSACPQDITPINGAECTPRDVAYLVLEGKES